METKRVTRRKHSAEFRAEVLQACRQSGASVAAIALRSGLNANVVHRWLRMDKRTDTAGAGEISAVRARYCAEFVPLQLPAGGYPIMENEQLIYLQNLSPVDFTPL